MIKSIRDICILSDVDKTLYSVQKGIPQRNIEAINRFKSKGGKFAIATGRSLQSAGDLNGAVEFNFPCILCNGGAIYDFSAEKYLDRVYLPKEYPTYLKHIADKYKYIGLVAVTEKGYLYLTDENKRYSKFQTEVIPVKYEEGLVNEVYKLLFSVPTEECQDILRDFQSMGFEGVHFSSSDAFYIDMLPENVNKGKAILKLAELTNTPLENIVTIGDYYNDWEMLSTTPLSACVAGCPEEIKKVCKIHLGDFENGAVADLIEYLEEKYER